MHTCSMQTLTCCLHGWNGMHNIAWQDACMCHHGAQRPRTHHSRAPWYHECERKKERKLVWWIEERTKVWASAPWFTQGIIPPDFYYGTTLHHITPLVGHWFFYVRQKYSISLLCARLSGRPAYRWKGLGNWWKHICFRFAFEVGPRDVKPIKHLA